MLDLESGGGWGGERGGGVQGVYRGGRSQGQPSPPLPSSFLPSLGFPGEEVPSPRDQELWGLLHGSCTLCPWQVLSDFVCTTTLRAKPYYTGPFYR